MSEAQGSSMAARVAYLGLPALALAFLTANPALTVVAVLSLLAIVLLVWRQGEPPVLLFVCFMQWIQGSLQVLHADVVGVPVQALSHLRSVEDAIVLTLIWTVAIAAGVRLAFVVRSAPTAPNALDALTPSQLFRLYIAWTVLLQLGGPIVRGGLLQVFLAIGQMRWAVVFALFWEAFRTRRNLGTVAIVFIVELVSGFFAFFSDFKTPIYLLALALPAGNHRLRPRQILGSLVIAAFALYLGAIWSAIKNEYRDTLSGGAEQQDVTIGRDEQARELVRLLGTVDGATLDRGVARLVDRITYVRYFSQAIDFVPAVRRHENGLLWGNALRHVLLPRLFFPDKAELESDTEIAQRYTGLRLAFSPGTSIALGTPAESYIDFGVPLMFLPALCMGLLCGGAYRRFARRGPHAALAQGFAVAMVVFMSSIELTPSKALGGLVTGIMVASILWQLLTLLVSRIAAPSLAAPPQPH
jgi:hypothetical protein